MADGLNRLLEPLLSPTEEADESRRDAPMEENPEAAGGLGETVQAGWQRVQHDQSLALTSIPVPHGEADGLPEARCYSGSEFEKTYDIGRDSRLTNGVCDVVSDVDGDGSEDYSSDGGSDSDSSDCSSDGGPRVRFDDLEDFSEGDDDSDAFSDSNFTPRTGGQNISCRRSGRAAAGRGHDVAPPATEAQIPFQAGHRDPDSAVPVTGPVSSADSDTTGQHAASLSGTAGAVGDIGGGLGAEGRMATQGQNKMQGKEKSAGTRPPVPRRPRPKQTEQEKAAKRRAALTQPYRSGGI